MTGDIVQGALREERKRAHATQQQIADYLGVDRSTYTYYESGKLRVPISVLSRLATYYDLPVSVFFSEPNRRIDFYSGGPSAEQAPQKRSDVAGAADSGGAEQTRTLTFEERQLLSQLRARVCCEDSEAVLESLKTDEIYDDGVLTYFADPDA